MIDIQNFLINKIGVDKLLHFFVCGWIVSFIDGLIFQIIVTIVLGVGKELIDKFIRKTYIDHKDMLFTWLGGTITIILKVLL